MWRQGPRLANGAVQAMNTPLTLTVQQARKERQAELNMDTNVKAVLHALALWDMLCPMLEACV